MEHRARLFTFSSAQPFDLAKSLAADSGDTVQFSQGDKESCMNYLLHPLRHSPRTKG